jgi:T-complex protein 1 subunit theta
MNLNQAKGMGGMLKQGHSMSDEGTNDAVSKNIEAAKGLARIVRSSMGPNGMNKLVLNHLEKTIVTSDCAAIVRELEIAHPAARMLTLAAEQQESEVGDGTNFVVTFAGELLRHAEDLLREGLHASEIVAGYKAAHTKALQILPTLVCHTVDDLRDTTKLAAAIKPVICSKQLGYEDLLAPVIAEACHMVMPSPASGKRPSVSVDMVRVCKLRGASVGDSRVMQGMVLTRDMNTTINRVEKAKLAIFGCGIEQSSTETKGTILLRNADELLNYNKVRLFRLLSLFSWRPNVSFVTRREF